MQEIANPWNDGPDAGPVYTGVKLEQYSLSCMGLVCECSIPVHGLGSAELEVGQGFRCLHSTVRKEPVRFLVYVREAAGLLKLVFCF